MKQRTKKRDFKIMIAHIEFVRMRRVRAAVEVAFAQFNNIILPECRWMQCIHKHTHTQSELNDIPRYVCICT